MADVIRWHRRYPDDWRQTWAECEKHYSADTGCSQGVFVPLSIDAVINSAYVIIGLLYGEGDMGKTIDISTRCGQDSDCNPASAAGILGTMLGYSRIPETWLAGLKRTEAMPFPFVDLSLNDAYRLSYGQALQMIERGGGTLSDDSVTIVCQRPEAVRMECAFEGHYPVEVININQLVEQIDTITFEGIGITFAGKVKSSNERYVAQVTMSIDGVPVETAALPASFITRRPDLFYRYQLPKGKHHVTFRWLNPEKGATVEFGRAIVYADAPQPHHL
jgi:hypothetical protein